MKKIRKTILTIILVAVNVLGCIFNVTAASIDIGRFTYSIDSYTGIVTIEECNEYYQQSTVEIPAFISTTTYGELPVLVIGDDFLRGCQHESVIIPYTVALIDMTSFYNCKSLKSIVVDENNPDYSSDEFGVLFNKDKTELIYCPQGMQNEHYTIPDSVTKISSYAFYNCTNLTEITIPESVSSIGNRAFYNCTGLTKINWNAKNVRSFSSEPDVFFAAGYDNDGIDVIFGENVESIPYGCFAGYEDAGMKSANIKNVTISKSVTMIGDFAFWGCKGLESIVIPDSVITIGSCAFFDCSDLISVTISDSVKTIDRCTFEGCTSLKNVTIGNSVESINVDAFYNCLSLKTINIPESVTYLSNNAFGNSGLEKIVINGKKCVIEYNASTIPVDAVIYGHINSPAQLYAQMYARDFVPLAASECEHFYGEWIIDADATCTQRGFSHRACTLCNGIEFAIIDETGHTDSDGDEVCDVCDTVLSAGGNSGSDDNDTTDNAMTNFINSIVEFFNKIVAFIKSLFGIA